VTNYISHNAWLEYESLLRGAATLATIPGILVNGRFDFQAPIGAAWTLKCVWPRADLWIVDDAGHSADSQGITSALIRATDHFAGLDERP
jgi:proline iminopeptidase